MTLELNLRFPTPEQVVVRLGDEETAALAFANPFTDKDRKDLSWYVETYGSRSLEGDEQEAERILLRLPVIGKALFKGVFGHEAARRLFNYFQEEEGETRLLTISSEHPAILGLPWELLHDSTTPDGTHLFHEQISLRRRFAGAGGGRKALKFTPKDRLNLLFVVSRPKDAGFINPRADATAVLDALEALGINRVTVEFLRPPTLDGLLARLDDEKQPPVDILHFDGHGVFDTQGGILEHRKGIHTEGLLREAGDSLGPPNTGYLLFEDGEGNSHLVSAAVLGANLQRCKVGLVILSACQSAAVGEAEPLGSVAARLTATGIPAVLAMTHSVLVVTTEKLFEQFYRGVAQGKGLGESLDVARRWLANHPEKYKVQRCARWEPLKLYDWFLPALYQSGDDTPMLRLDDKTSRHSGMDRRTNRQDSRFAQLCCPKGEGQGLSLMHPDCRDADNSSHPWSLGSGAPCRNDEENHNSSALNWGTMLPAKPEAGFFGRTRELWNIERWFAGTDPRKATRRISITGFGGQGKTALALEAGRWLLRTGLFRAAVFVNYAQTATHDAVEVAVSAIAATLGLSLTDKTAVTAVLRDTPTLLILDNLEALAADALQELLEAAVAWSEAGGSRVLLTSRRPEFPHPAYRSEGTRKHRRIVLDGLQPNDALDWHQELRKLPPDAIVPMPTREALQNLFGQVRFHPLSIRVLAAQLKTRRIAELGERLEQLLLVPSPPTGFAPLASLSPQAGEGSSAKPLSPEGRGVGERGKDSEDIPIVLIASLHLSLEKLDAEAKALLPKLGVFQGGALESQLLKITGMEPKPWAELRSQLEAAALVEAESLSDVNAPYLRFHPTLAPLLWMELNADQQKALSADHRANYYALASGIYQADLTNPHAARAIVKRELPNLLHAVRSALEQAEPNAVEFADSMSLFLGYFGLRGESEALNRLAQGMASDSGSQDWFLAQTNRGEQLRASGQINEAAQMFTAILQALGEGASVERAQTLGRLGRCYKADGRPDVSADYLRQALAVLGKLETSNSVKRQRGACLTDLADALTDMGHYNQARQAYTEGLVIAKEQDDLRQQGVILSQLGTLALREGNTQEAAKRYSEALTLFQTLQEPASEAIAWHQLGRVYQDTQQWDEAERCYRESARINVAQGNLSRAASTWNQLAMGNVYAGKPEAAEQWYRKAIEAGRSDSNPLGLASRLNNLAGLLLTQASRLPEARQLAEEALKLRQTLEPGVAEIWKSYGLLAQIAEQEAAVSQDRDYQQQQRQAAREYRRLARDAYRAFPGNKVSLKPFAPLILNACHCCAATRQAAPWYKPWQRKPAVDSTAHTQARAEVAQYQEQMRQAGPDWIPLADALDRLLAGERKADTLCEGLHFQAALIMETILQGIADPDNVAWLREDEGTP